MVRAPPSSFGVDTSTVVPATRYRPLAWGYLLIKTQLLAAGSIVQILFSHPIFVSLVRLTHGWTPHQQARPIPHDGVVCRGYKTWVRARKISSQLQSKITILSGTNDSQIGYPPWWLVCPIICYASCQTGWTYRRRIQVRSAKTRCV